MSRLTSGAAIAAMLAAALAAGCGSHRSATTHTERTITAHVTHTTATPKRQKPSTVGGPFVGTCPKVIRATCIPGVHYAGSIVCVGKNRRVARTLTRQDLVRLDRQARKLAKERREGKHPKLPKPPTELSLRKLPNGKMIGVCNYGGGPPPVPSPSPASIAGNE